MVEIMIVVVIIGLVSATAISRFFNRDNSFKEEVRNFKLLTSSLHNSAKLSHLTFRIVIQMGDESGDGPHKYWVENSTKAGAQISEKDSSEQRSGFTKNTSVLKKEMTLPNGVKFESVEIAGEDQPITQGNAYIYFTPQGLVDESAIHISAGEGLDWTIAIHPLTGKSDIFTTKVLLKDLRNQ